MVIEWVAVGILVFIALFVFKIEHHTRKYKVFAAVLVGLIIYLSIVGIFSSEKVDMSSPRGVVNAVYLYFGWLGETSVKLWDIGVETTNMVGNAIRVDEEEEKK